ncbi:hypothetical protein CL617_01235 [archaeon]|nr:hypothetical protein [archaeon]|tara:strand:+ start:7536 stop:9494 length:1959 start_codon:yes stop_codon:yes gene_type:complete
MKPITILLTLLFLLPTAIAIETENLNYYENIDVEVKIGSKINIIPESSDYLIEDFTADLSIFPKKTDVQYKTINKEITSSTPQALESKGEYSIKYTWNKPEVDKLEYEYTSELSSKIKFPKVNIKIPFPVNKDNLPEGVIQFTEANEFIESDNPEIINLANELASGSDDLYEVVFKISQWTNNNIDYSLETLTAEIQQSSVWVLQNRKGVCDELTVLTMAMLRSLGIPTKFVSGSSYTDLINGFGNHAWLEVYFPNYGWVEFDPTYGQYGYVDATHIKMKESKLAKESAVKYTWSSRDAEIKTEKLQINVSVTEKGEKLKPLIDIKLKPLKNKISGGSTVPIEISLENKNDFYIPVSLIVTKAPTQLFNNQIDTLLKPSETKSEFITIEVPNDIKSGFIYTSDLEIIDFFGSLATAEIEFSQSYDDYSKSKAKELIDSLTKEEEKTYSRDVNLECNSKKETYYKYENTGIINCNLENKGNTNIEDIEVCLGSYCQSLNIPISKTKEVDFSFTLDRSKDLKITAENKDTLKHSFISIHVLESPNLNLKELTYPQTIKYRDNSEILFTLNTEAKVQNLTINVDKKDVFYLDMFEDEGDFRIPFEGSYFFNKESKMIISYNDLNGKEYSFESPFHMEVTNVPWYQNLFSKVKNIF